MTEAERYKCVIKILEDDVKQAREKAVKEFSHFLIDNADGSIHISDLPDMVVDFLNGRGDQR